MSSIYKGFAIVPEYGPDGSLLGYSVVIGGVKHHVASIDEAKRLIDDREKDPSTPVPDPAFEEEEKPAPDDSPSPF